jgi:hypothetical protein
VIVVDPGENHDRAGVDDHLLGDRAPAGEGLNSANYVKTLPLEKKFIIAIQGKFSSFPTGNERRAVKFQRGGISVSYFAGTGKNDKAAENLPNGPVGVKITGTFALSSEDVFRSVLVRKLLCVDLRILLVNRNFAT